MGDFTGSDYTKKERFRCQLITWGEAAGMSRELARMVYASRFEPDIIIAIGRGGYVPARVVSDYLLFRDLTTIKMEHWGVAATIDEQAHIRFGLSTDISNMRVLLVDDITDTGDTLQVALDYIKDLNPAKVCTAVLQHKTCSSFIPDFYVHRILKWRWIIYPWAMFEDISGFIKRIVGNGWMSVQDIQQRLSHDFQLSISIGKLAGILEDMEMQGLIGRSGNEGRSVYRDVD
ncbi:MAG: phosphoribosyltransferase [ANME-2 cluster archaeon]|nr:phosphoribosyltransferase [ANME-2 cluster archaeon]MDF1557261.1 phosphoribosyltransferase [ANME-2 cluster archaeon]